MKLRDKLTGVSAPRRATFLTKERPLPRRNTDVIFCMWLEANLRFFLGAYPAAQSR
jgi:hypothetical protein